MTTPSPSVILVVLDGWGVAPPGPGNAIASAKLPNYTKLLASCPNGTLQAYGEAVGLPKREPGNTETGHLNLGSGRIVYQDLPRINISIADGSFFQNPQFLAAANHVRSHKSKLHLVGLIGGGGTHSDVSHLFALLRFCREQALSQVFVHAITDGRDSPPTSASTYLTQVQNIMTREATGQFATIMGRYYGLDRDFRWDRTAEAYFALTEGRGQTASSFSDCLASSYAAGITDEFIHPTILLTPNSNPVATIAANDAVIFFNFRIDRPRQLTKALVLPDFATSANLADFDPYAVRYHQKHVQTDSEMAKPPPFARPNLIPDLFFVTMTQYERRLPVHVAFPPLPLSDTLGETISKGGLAQLRLAESEKERFVTYYFNGLHELPFPNELRLIVRSPAVATYDLQPAMSSLDLTTHMVRELTARPYQFALVNFAPPDMVAHTGNIQATIQACEAIDSCLGTLADLARTTNSTLIVTADHGNAEEMINPTTNTTDTEHNANPVPLIISSNTYSYPATLPPGILADIAPTILSLLNIPIPSAMTGRNLLANIHH